MHASPLSWVLAVASLLVAVQAYWMGDIARKTATLPNVPLVSFEVAVLTWHSAPR